MDRQGWFGAGRKNAGRMSALPVHVDLFGGEGGGLSGSILRTWGAAVLRPYMIVIVA